MGGLLRPEVLGTNHEAYPLFRCPSCRFVGEIDKDQFLGKVSILCERPGCTYHETRDWSKDGACDC